MAIGQSIANLVSRQLRATYVCTSRRLMSADIVKSLVYEEYGEPAEVLRAKTDCIRAPCQKEVTVQWLYAPVNPADVNTIQGKYPSKPPLPAVAGNEGLGQIIAVGPDCRDFCVGDKVVPNGVNKGTWQTHGIYQSDEMFKIHSHMDPIVASMLNVNPCTAYRMLKDFGALKQGDTVIQNGANSAVGQFVIQLCKLWGFRTVNVVRERPDVQNLKDQLLKLGADLVLTEQELRTTDVFKSKKLPQPKLALNCVCGKNAAEVQRHLAHSGIMVTYGAMSREPLTVPASSLIFKNISFQGFWMTAWTNKNTDTSERSQMLDELQRLFMENKLQAPAYELVPFADYAEAVTNALKPGGQKNVKYILDLTRCA